MPLEEICEDRNAAGHNLKLIHGKLGQNVTIPQELIEAADELRLLGNDAAHVNVKDYDVIGREEAPFGYRAGRGTSEVRVSICR